MKDRLTWPVKATGTSIRQIMKASSRGQLEHFAPRKGKNMNENINDTNLPLAEVYPALGLVEVLDADGNPTRAYEPRSDGEAAREETTIFAAEDDSDGHVIVH